MCADLDQLSLSGIAGVESFGHHGASEAERERGEKFYFDVSLTTDVLEAGQWSDDTYNPPFPHLTMEDLTG